MTQNLNAWEVRFLKNYLWFSQMSPLLICTVNMQHSSHVLTHVFIPCMHVTLSGSLCFTGLCSSPQPLNYCSLRSIYKEWWWLNGLRDWLLSLLDLSLILGTHIAEGQNWFLQVVFWPPHVCCGMHMCAHTRTHTHVHIILKSVFSTLTELVLQH